MKSVLSDVVSRENIRLKILSNFFSDPFLPTIYAIDGRNMHDPEMIEVPKCLSPVWYQTNETISKELVHAWVMTDWVTILQSDNPSCIVEKYFFRTDTDEQSALSIHVDTHSKENFCDFTNQQLHGLVSKFPNTFMHLEAQYVAARSHHLCRWKLPRDAYPEGRLGYLRWRKEARMQQAVWTKEILFAQGYSEQFLSLVEDLLMKQNLRDNMYSQRHEDALCLTFFVLQFPSLFENIPQDKLQDIVVKTFKKMSPVACELVFTVGFSTPIIDFLRQCRSA